VILCKMIVRTSKANNIAMNQQNWSTFLPLVCFKVTNASNYMFPTITLHLVDANRNKIIDFVLALKNYLSS